MSLSSYPVFSVGLDWVTGTARNAGNALAFERLGDWLLSDERKAGSELRSVHRFGFEGWQAGEVYFGRRSDGLLVSVSGCRAACRGTDVITASDNISRVDFQVTILTTPDLPSIGANGFEALERRAASRGRPFAYALTVQRPTGETLTINKRCSSYYGRIYDKASESKVGPRNSLWRYELEVKGPSARMQAHRYCSAESPVNFTSTLVHRWFSAKGLVLNWENPRDDLAGQNLLAPRTAGGLRFLETQVRPHVRNMIHKHGLSRVLRALAIEHLVQPRIIGG